MNSTPFQTATATKSKLRFLAIDSSYLPIISIGLVLFLYFSEIGLCIWQVNDFRINENDYFKKYENFLYLLDKDNNHEAKPDLTAANELFIVHSIDLFLYIISVFLYYMMIIIFYKNSSVYRIFDIGFNIMERTLTSMTIFTVFNTFNKAHMNFKNQLVFTLVITAIIEYKFITSKQKINAAIKYSIVCAITMLILGLFLNLTSVFSIMYDQIVNVMFNDKFQINQLENACKLLNFNIKNIFVDNESPITNAFSVKNLNSNAIVITGKLFDMIPLNHLISIIAHEVGHIVKNHSIQMIITILSLQCALYIFLKTTYNKLNKSHGNIVAILFILNMVIVIKFISKLGFNIIGHAMEYAADKHILNIANKQNAMSMLYNLSYILETKAYYHKYIPGLLFDHPSTFSRICALKNCK